MVFNVIINISIIVFNDIITVIITVTIVVFNVIIDVFNVCLLQPGQKSLLVLENDSHSTGHHLDITRMHYKNI